ncbi:Protein W02A11.1 [Anopheles sinensis]|uniref:Protein W02A11.1 n=1 Tax=Anopheles sinensis TaxID=74873 RepID=A0A084VY90_ANOSI|nr:Protein W02A11.1 [Anopheles sinensis]
MLWRLVSFSPKVLSIEIQHASMAFLCWETVGKRPDRQPKIRPERQTMAMESFLMAGDPDERARDIFQNVVNAPPARPPQIPVVVLGQFSDASPTGNFLLTGKIKQADNIPNPLHRGAMLVVFSETQVSIALPDSILLAVRITPEKDRECD